MRRVIMRGWVLIISIISLCLLLLPSCRAGESVGVVGLSSIEDSRLVLGVVDLGICYRSVNWTLFSQSNASASIEANGDSLWSGTVEGVEFVTTLFANPGVVRCTVTIAGRLFVYRLTVINQSAEDWVRDWVLHGGMVEMTTWGILWLTVKTHLVSIGIFFLPAPFVFKWIVKRKESEVREAV